MNGWTDYKKAKLTVSPYLLIKGINFLVKAHSVAKTTDNKFTKALK